MRSETAFVLTVLVFCYAVISGLVRRWYLAPALIFVAVGVVLGPSGLGVVGAGTHTEGFTVLAQLALTVILFNQASRLDLRTVLRRGYLPLRLLAIGMPVTIALGTATAVLVLPMLPVWEAVCLAVIVAPPRSRSSMPCSRTAASPSGSGTHFRSKAASTTGSRWRLCSPRWRWPPSRPITRRGTGRCSRFAPSLSRWSPASSLAWAAAR